jgi:hypothetical protein
MDIQRLFDLIKVHSAHKRACVRIRIVAGKVRDDQLHLPMKLEAQGACL